MPSSRLLLAAAVAGLFAFPALPARASPEGDETVSPEQSKLILDYWHKQCDGSHAADCAPDGVDLEKNEVRVLERDLLARNKDVDDMQTQTLADEQQAHNAFALYLHYCKPPAPMKLNVDIAVYKLRGTHAWEVANAVVDKMRMECAGFEKSPETIAAIHLFQKVKLIHVKFAPPSPALEQDVDYSFDAKTGTLTVLAFAKNPLPSSSSMDKHWQKLLKNN